jgi:hypothetical protein
VDYKRLHDLRDRLLREPESERNLIFASINARRLRGYKKTWDYNTDQPATFQWSGSFRRVIDAQGRVTVDRTTRNPLPGTATAPPATAPPATPSSTPVGFGLREKRPYSFNSVNEKVSLHTTDSRRASFWAGSSPKKRPLSPSPPRKEQKSRPHYGTSSRPVEVDEDDTEPSAFRSHFGTASTFDDLDDDDFSSAKPSDFDDLFGASSTSMNLDDDFSSAVPDL